jgi:hypothetical protein
MVTMVKPAVFDQQKVVNQTFKRLQAQNETG